MLIKNKQFICAVLVFWLMQGVYFTLTTLLEPVLQFFNNGGLDSLFVGTLGTILTITGTITTLVLPIISDKSKSKKRKPIVLACQVGHGSLCWSDDCHGMLHGRIPDWCNSCPDGHGLRNRISCF